MFQWKSKDVISLLDPRSPASNQEFGLWYQFCPVTEGITQFRFILLSCLCYPTESQKNSVNAFKNCKRKKKKKSPISTVIGSCSYILLHRLILWMVIWRRTQKACCWKSSLRTWTIYPLFSVDIEHKALFELCLPSTKLLFKGYLVLWPSAQW